MEDYVEETDSGIYRITRDGEIFTQSKLKIPIVGKGMEFTGEFKVKLKPERKMTYQLNNRGYLSVGIKRKTFMVHRLIAKAFIPNPKAKPFINHIDGNKLNNHINNLEWCTTAENNEHARRTGLHVQPRGHKINYKSAETKKKALKNLKDKSMLTPEEVRYVRKVYIPRCREFGASELARKFGVSCPAMCKIVKGETYKNIV